MNAATTLIALCTATVATAAFAGPLTPPPGAVASTGKTTDQIEPRTPVGPLTTPATNAGDLYEIDEPGSYYLTGNIAFAGTAIRITAEDVTLDLNGFAVDGLKDQNPGVASSGIDVDAPEGRVRIHNGTIRNQTTEGVSVFSTPTLVLDSVLVRDCQVGFFSRGPVIARDCTATGNEFDGFSIGSSAFARSVLDRCTARNNGVHGFDVLGVSLSGCTAEGNGGDGIFAVRCTLQGCVSGNNTGNGFRISGGSLDNAYTQSNGRFGVDFDNAVIRGCTCLGDNLTGIGGSSDGSILDCHVDGTQVGIDAGEDIRVERCNIVNVNTGIHARSGSVAIANTISGIFAGGAAILDTGGTTGPIVTANGATLSINTSAFANIVY